MPSGFLQRRELTELVVGGDGADVKVVALAEVATGEDVQFAFEEVLLRVAEVHGDAADGRSSPLATNLKKTGMIEALGVWKH